MITYTGRSVWPDGIEAPSVEDIAVGLGRTARFAGQTQTWYPVLAHTLVVANLVAPEHRFHALMHDAPEAIVGDVPTTWKTDQARACEAELLMRIYFLHRRPLPDTDTLEAVREADIDALGAEARVLGHSRPRYFEVPTWRALAETTGQLVNCRNYLEPVHAIRAFTRALDACP